MTSYALHPGAFEDLVDIWEFIAKDSLEAADRVRDQIHNAIRFVARNPNSGHWRRDLSSRPVRFHRVYDYLIVYAPEEMPVTVLAIIHGRRNPRVLAAMLQGRE